MDNVAYITENVGLFDFFINFFSCEEWGYCGLSGETRYGARCVSECAQKGKDYW